MRMLIRRFMYLLVCMMFPFWFHSLSAQDTLRERYGIEGNFMVGFHSADFQTMPGTQSCCAGFTGGSGGGFRGGLLAELPITDNVLLSARVSYAQFNYSMSQVEATRIIVQGIGQDGAFEHRLNGSLSSLGLEMNTLYRIGNSLFLSGGVQLAFPISGTYEQKDQLTQPSGVGTFLDINGQDSKKRTRNEYQGTIPNMSILVSPTIGVSYELPLNRRKSIFLAPEFFYQIGLNTLSRDIDWNLQAIRLAIAFKYSPPPPKIPVDLLEEKIDTVRIEVPVLIRLYSKGRETRNNRQEETETEIHRISMLSRTDTIFHEPKRYLLNAEISAFEISKDGTESSVITITRNETISVTAHPLLHCIFFDSGESEVPAKYNRIHPKAAEVYNPEKAVYPDKMTAYYNVLNVIGSRLRTNTSATVVLTGCTDEQGIEAGNIDLARRRAESVKTYLTSIFGVASSRIITSGRLLPQKPARSLSKEAFAENRRVEITSTTSDILAPVIGADTQYTVRKPIVRFKPTVTSEAGLSSWEIHPAYNSNVQNLSGKNTLPQSVEWVLEDSIIPIINSDKYLLASLDVTDTRGQSVHAETSIPLTVVTNRSKMSKSSGTTSSNEHFSVVLFDINSSDLNGAHKQVGTYMKRWLVPHASLKIIGYADLSGDPMISKRLAEARATSVAKALGVFGKAQIEGRTENLYDNNTPEGRFYSRTVDIIPGSE